MHAPAWNASAGAAALGDVVGVGDDRPLGADPGAPSSSRYRPNYVTAMGVVVKALGGPEPAEPDIAPPTTLRGGRGTPLKIAVIDTHLINNAFGVSIRGERRLRRRLWRKAWREVKRLRRWLQKQGYAKAQLYGRDTKVYGGLNAFFLLMDKPETYKLPNEANATLPSRNNLPGYVGGVATAVVGLIAGLLAFRNGRMNGNNHNTNSTNAH